MIGHDEITAFQRRQIQREFDEERRQIQREFDEARRQARVVRVKEPVVRRWGEIYAKLAYINECEKAALEQLDQEHRQWTEKKDASKRGRTENLKPGSDGDLINTTLFKKVRDAIETRFGIKLESIPALKDKQVDMIVAKELAGVGNKHRRAIRQRIRRMRSKRDGISRT